MCAPTQLFPTNCPLLKLGSLICVLLFLAAGCTQHKTEEVTEVPEPLEEPVSVEPHAQSPGSLWNGDEGNWFADIKARKVGDIVTVIIAEQASASKSSSTATDRGSSISAAIPKLFGYEQVLQEKNATLDMSALVEASFANQFTGSGSTTRSENLAATLTTQVIKIYPNGNLKIRGGKSVTVNSENQIIYLTGIIRPFDISADNTVDSGNILNAQIAYTGKGAISDKQKPGWLMRVFDNVWPF